jgi:hypothetical protein
MRPATLFVLSITAAALPLGCGGGHTVFGSSNSTGTGGHGNGTTTGPGTGGTSGQTGSGGMTSTTTSSSSSSGTTTTTSSSSSSSTTSTSSGTYPAPFPAPPQVAFVGGPTLSAPQIYPVFFSNDDAATVASLADFTMNVGGTPYWTATTSEYGVGPATGHAAIMLAETAPGQIDDSQIQQWLAQKFAMGAPFPAANANDLIIIYYPAGTTITLQGAQSCSTFGGYHNSAQVNGQDIAYAVVPRCGSLANTTGDASHELVEAVTDPFPMVNPAYPQVDDAHYYWEILFGGGEVGDMCAQFPWAFTQFPGFNYTVQRTWSNKSVKAGKDPCQPETPGEVYFNAAPVLGTVPHTYMGQPLMISGVNIPQGSSKMIPVQLYSEGPTAPWTVSVTDLSPMLTGGQLTLSLDKSSGQNGDVLNLTITVNKAGNNNIDVFLVKSVQAGQSQHGDWYAAVTN